MCAFPVSCFYRCYASVTPIPLLVTSPSPKIATWDVPLVSVNGTVSDSAHSLTVSGSRVWSIMLHYPQTLLNSYLGHCSYEEHLKQNKLSTFLFLLLLFIIIRKPWSQKVLNLCKIHYLLHFLLPSYGYCFISGSLALCPSVLSATLLQGDDCSTDCWREALRGSGVHQSPTPIAVSS